MEFIKLITENTVKPICLNKDKQHKNLKYLRRVA